MLVAELHAAGLAILNRGPSGPLTFIGTTDRGPNHACPDFADNAGDSEGTCQAGDTSGCNDWGKALFGVHQFGGNSVRGPPAACMLPPYIQWAGGRRRSGGLIKTACSSAYTCKAGASWESLDYARRVCHLPSPSSHGSIPLLQLVPASATGSGTASGQGFPIPKFSPSFFSFAIDKDSGTLSVTSSCYLKDKDGNPITGGREEGDGVDV